MYITQETFFVMKHISLLYSWIYCLFKKFWNSVQTFIQLILINLICQMLTKYKLRKIFSRLLLWITRAVMQINFLEHFYFFDEWIVWSSILFWVELIEMRFSNFKTFLHIFSVLFKLFLRFYSLAYNKPIDTA